MNPHDVKPNTNSNSLCYVLYDSNGVVFNTFDPYTPRLTASPLWPSQLRAGAATDVHSTAPL